MSVIERSLFVTPPSTFSDPEIMLLLNYLADSFAPWSGTSHFALMADEDVTSVEKDR